MSQRYVILNADDLGYDPAVTRGILEAMRSGIVSSTTLMVNTPFSEDAARAASGLSIGLHLNLARNRPVSGAIPAELLAGGELVEARAAELPAGAVTAEAHAQLDRLRALLGTEATHLDVHKHLHRHPAILAGLARAARERGLPVRSIDPAMRAELRRHGVATNDAFLGDAGATAYWTLPQLEADLGRVVAGVSELMCHPGYAPERVKSGYAQQREGELATFVDPRARALLAKAGVVVTDFRILHGART